MERKEKPECIYRSPSNRTTQTIDLLTDAASWSDVKIQNLDWLYLASRRDFLTGIENMNNDYDFICMCAHNPGITDIVNYLGGDHIANMPTCGIALIEFEANDWKEVSGGTGKLLLFDYPKNN
jgi:phosphohistidine phosphatase